MRAPALVALALSLVACSPAAPRHDSPALPDADDSTPESTTPPTTKDSGSPAPSTPDAGVSLAPDAAPAPAPDTGMPMTPPPPPTGDVMAVETVQVPASGDAVTMKTTLGTGEIFLLRASGVVDLGAQKLDAEYLFGSGMPADQSGGSDVGVDIGMLQIHAMIHRTPTPPGPGRMKWLTGYRDDHVYFMTVTGEGKALTLKLTKTGSGTGAITVALIPLSPAPPKLSAALETVMVPVTKTMVTSTMSPAAGKLYLLQASGSAKCGGGGLAMGDAEYMDWAANGSGANEGEAGADFGIAVDELPAPKMAGAAYTPRMRWWGPWRMDHTYYMVYVGSGKPIQLLYIDSGYGDNSATAKLGLKIFELP